MGRGLGDTINQGMDKVLKNKLSFKSPKDSEFTMRISKFQPILTCTKIQRALSDGRINTVSLR
jgi:hypothetical protein